MGKGKNKAAVALGKLGAAKRNENLTDEQRTELATRAANKRWSDKRANDSICSYCGKSACELHPFASKVTREVYEQRSKRD